MTRHWGITEQSKDAIGATIAKALDVGTGPWIKRLIYDDRLIDVLARYQDIPRINMGVS